MAIGWAMLIKKNVGIKCVFTCFLFTLNVLYLFNQIKFCVYF
jgi:hypothetical protein